MKEKLKFKSTSLCDFQKRQFVYLFKIIIGNLENKSYDIFNINVKYKNIKEIYHIYNIFIFILFFII
ncbi:hypothetical protein PFAG_00334 [Plasmodium falciparum Santa Lucia]|uniref:Uncharacterized protein n=4 Tax=Plasmodium falciparum TaxID=5833 RepID=A0A024WEV7_PLAFA|nr:hypothetical protein PFFVO_00402 [Plasmodium falciparum Vietnam Oak-Knoll (FVO)]ETW38811.1 hypothetical protein PFTANZ_00467 [Plasmodium falciparum Tanzania (2000708)]ETW45107.1 hypothetical protein PFNF135_00436 [Plasmodium falciparum NF135/5.C10]EUT92194.1 hypothetical protein PFAG_00334 [Plasmodium falciparum Santa Lucia]